MEDEDYKEDNAMKADKTAAPSKDSSRVSA
jgi:hypothetical protein